MEIKGNSGLEAGVINGSEVKSNSKVSLVGIFMRMGSVKTSHKK